MLRDWSLLACLVFVNIVRDGDVPPNDMDDGLRNAIAQTYDTPSKSFMEGIVARRSKWADEDSKEENSLFFVIVVSLVLENDYNFPLATDPRDRINSLLTLAKDIADSPALLDYHLSSCTTCFRSWTSLHSPPAQRYRTRGQSSRAHTSSETWCVSCTPSPATTTGSILPARTVRRAHSRSSRIF